ncbi:MAG: fibronectin type III domain-containing protein [Chitinophagaceae bacterium]
MPTNGCFSDWGIAGYASNYNAILAMVDSMTKYVRLDEDRVFVDGLSNGGVATWSITAVFPQRVAKAAPSSAATAQTNYSEFVHVPIWFATGGKDTNPTPSYAQSSYNGVKNLGGDIQWTLYPDLGHFTWTTHWAEPNFVPYMNDMHKANPLVYFQRYDYCPDSVINARIGITAGFYEYQWQKDGVTIATRVNGVNTIINGTSINSYTGNEVTVNAFGTYRVRFRRSATSNFSAWSPKPAVIYPKSTTVTVPIAVNGLNSNVLPSIDGTNTVSLTLPAGFYGYQWVRIGDNAIVSTSRTYSAPIGQYKAKTLEQFGCGSSFSPVFTVINATGSPKPDAAKNLVALSNSANGIQLDWNQNPNAGQNETGFEIYRSTTSGGPYKLITITNPDVVSYIDQTILANTQYYYLVRAVSAFGAAANSNEAAASAQPDLIAPSIPSGLTVVCASRTNVTLKWNPSTDNLAVDKYDIYVNGVKSYTTTQTSFAINELASLQTFAFSVRAKDVAGNVSQPSNQVNANTAMQGLCYKYYQNIVGLPEIPNYNTQIPNAQGIASNLAFTAGGTGLNNFGYLWEGYIKITTAGTNTYRFQTCSDDGSKFYFDQPYNHTAAAAVDNNGLHGTTCITSASFSLTAGQVFPIAASFFEESGGEAMTLNWSINSTTTFTAIPSTNFTETFTPAGTAPTAPSNLAGNSPAFNKINLTWTDNSANETGFEIVRSTSLAGTYNPVATLTGTSYTDSGLTANTAYYYKVRSIGSYGQSAYTAAVTVTTIAGPAIPAAPGNLIALVVSKDNINLTWNDNSTNETNFEVWRSVGNQSNYRMIKSIAGGAGATKNYSDNALFANVTYYYVIKAVGLGGTSGNSNVANATTLNTVPVITNILDFTMKYATVYSLPINSIDADGDPMTFNFENLPYFATIENVSNGNINIVFSPTVGDQGAYTITAIVNDGHNGLDTTFYTMVINDNTVPLMNAITDKVVDEGKTLVIPLAASDAEGNNDMIWTFENMPSFGTFVDSGNGKGSITVKPGYSASGNYTLTAYVDDGSGAWTSRNFKITVIEVDPNETIRINFKTYSGNVPTWNDVDLYATAPFNKPSLVTIKGQTTPIGITAINNYYGGSASGVQTGSNAGIYPDAVMKDYMEWGTYNYGFTDTMRMRVYGLDTARRYNFAFFGSSTNNCCGVNSNSITTYRINNDVATVRFYLNINETDTIYQVKPNAAGQIDITMIGDANTAQGGVLNTLVLDAAFDDGTAPAKPLNLNGYFTENVGVRLNWTDRAYNEFSYKVYRATSKTGPYTLLNPAGQNKDSTGYSDFTSIQYTNYFYYVAGSNNYGNGASSDTITILTENNKPVIVNLDNFRVKTDASFQENFSVTDLVTDVVTVSIAKSPSFISLISLGGGNYRITANPTIDNLGQHFLTVVAKDDKGGTSTKDFIITVADKNTNSVFVSLGDYSKVSPAPWNNFLHYGIQGQTINNLVDENNVPTTFSMQMTDGWNSMFLTGHKTGNNSGVIPDSVLSGGIYYTGTLARVITISGLNPTKRYNIIAVGSQNEGYTAVMRMISNVSTQSDTLNARYNTNLTANLNGLIAPAGGIITVSFNKLSGNAMYLNAIIIEEYESAITIVNPVNLYVEPKDQTSVYLSWSDRSNNESAASDGFQLQRATDSLFTQNITNINIWANNSVYTNTGLSANTKYWYRIRAKTAGGIFSDWSNRVKTVTPESIVRVNFNQNVQNASSPWNNLQSFPSVGTSYANLKNQSNINTGYTLSITKTFNGENNAGMSTGNNSGMDFTVPDVVMQSGYWIDNVQDAQMKISGLNQNKRYRVGYISSSNWIGGNLTATFTVNGRTVYINSWQNTSKIVYIGDLQPNQSGELELNFSSTEPSANAYSSGIIVESYDDVNGGAVLNSINPVKPISGNITQEDANQNLLLSVDKESLVTVSSYPNPFVDIVNLDFTNKSSESTIGVDVYDLSGRLILKRNYGKLSEGANTIRLNTGEGKLTAGIYFIALSVDGKIASVTKLVKTKQ